MVLAETYPRRRVRRLRKRIVEDPPDDLTKEDRNALIKFDEQLTQDRKKNRRCGWSHHASLLNDLLAIATETQMLAKSLEDGDVGENAVSRITTWIHDDRGPDELEDKSPYTIQSQLSAIRNFAATVLDVSFEDLPERFAEIEPGAFVEKEPAPKPGQVLTFEDVVEMAKELDSTRDKALLFVQWALGMRPQKELWTLQYEDLEFKENHAEVTLPNEHGKGDRRTLMLAVGWTLLKKWVEEDHPAHADPEESMDDETFIWVRETENTHLDYGSLAARFRVAGERAGISKKHSPQHFRRSSASILAGKPHITERDLRYRYSWARNSFAPKHYIQVFSESTQRNVARARGFEVDEMSGLDRESEVKPIVCPDCKEWTERGLDTCVWCGHNLEDEQVTIKTGGPKIESSSPIGEKSVEELIFDGDITPEEMRILLDVEPHIRSDPQFFEKIEEYLPRAEALHEQDSDFIGAHTVAGAVARLSAWSGSVAKSWGRAKHVAMSIHPAFEGYPPNAKETAQFLGGVGLILGVSGFVLYLNGLLGEIASGKPTAVIALVVSVAIGVWMVHRDMPSIDEAVEAAAQE